MIGHGLLRYLRTAPSAVVCQVLVACVAASAPSARAQPVVETPAADHDVAGREIDRLVRQLGAASYTERTAATKRLITLGPPALAALRRAADGDDFEIALRARHLVALFHELLFTGMKVTLTADRTDIAWSDPVALDVRFDNASDYESRVPFDLTLGAPDAAVTPLRQVIGLLDLAHYLEIVGPDGQPLRLHVDDLGDDPRILDEVNARVDRPPISIVRPGAAVVYRVTGINRGPIRFRTLRAGRYHLRFVHQPPWDDPEMLRAGVGKITSNEVIVNVEKSAPTSVLTASGPAALRLVRDGGDMVATLTNQSDVPVRVNLNVSSSRGAPFAKVRWFVDCGDGREALAAEDASAPASAPFAHDRIAELPPAQTINLMRQPRAAFAGAESLRPTHDGGACTLSFSYTNVACRAWQRNHAPGALGNPKARGAVLPPHMLVTTLTSNAVPLDGTR